MFKAENRLLRKIVQYLPCTEQTNRVALVLATLGFSFIPYAGLIRWGEAHGGLKMGYKSAITEELEENVLSIFYQSYFPVEQSFLLDFEGS